MHFFTKYGSIFYSILEDNRISFFTLLFLIVVFYMLIKKSIDTSRMSEDRKRRTISNTRVSLIFLMFIASVFIWSSQLYSTILSFAALAAAFAIAAKELLLCVAGTFYRTFARPFTVGDRIYIDDLRGDVIDVGLLSTQLMEVGPGNLTQQFTGRMVVVPNSTFLLQNVINESGSAHGNHFVLHTFSIPVLASSDWRVHENLLLESAKSECAEFFDAAKVYFEAIAKRRHVIAPFVEPQITVQVSSITELILVVRITVPALLKGRIEQKILKNYLDSILV